MMQLIVLLLTLFVCGTFARHTACDLPRPIQVEMKHLNEIECLSRTYCWDIKNDGSGVCMAARRAAHCETQIPEDEREACNAPNHLVCRMQGCCWDDTASGKMRCFRQKVENPCNIPENDREPCEATRACDCWAQKCCYDSGENPHRPSCYRPKGCEDDFTLTPGPCSQTCGIGVRVLFDACGRISDKEICCDGPCVGGKGPAPSDLRCADHPPYGSWQSRTLTNEIATETTSP